MTARAGDALSHALFSVRRALSNRHSVSRKLRPGSRPSRWSVIADPRIVIDPWSAVAEKIRSTSDCMAAMSPRPGTEAAG
jgi:hypothetical protein